MLIGNTLDNTILKTMLAIKLCLPPMQQFYLRMSVGKHKPWHIHIWRISGAKILQLTLAHMEWQRHWWGMMGNRAETPVHKHPLVSASKISRWQGTPATPQEPNNLSLKQKTQGPACARAWASSLGLSSVHRNIPMRPLGIKRKKPHDTWLEDRSHSLKCNSRPKPKRW